MKKSKTLFEHITDVVTCWTLTILLMIIVFYNCKGTYILSTPMAIVFMIGYWTIVNSIIKFTDWNFKKENYENS